MNSKRLKLRASLDKYGLEPTRRFHNLKVLKDLLKIVKDEGWKEQKELEYMIEEHGTEDFEILTKLISAPGGTVQNKINERVLRELELLNRKINE